MKKWILLATTLILILTSCVNAVPTPTSTPTSAAAKKIVATQPLPTPTATITPTPQVMGEPISYGPNTENFPTGINPLTGLPVADPALLDEPALLLSVPHFPTAARPQSGLSFASWVFEFLISEGTTRFLAVFHGELPYDEEPIIGDCDVRTEPLVHEGEHLGNLVWLDQNEDGIQSPGERGVAGVCVNLYDDKGNLIAESSTDSNGYYGFPVEAGENYQVEFVQPVEMNFSPANIGDERFDSDADPESGKSGVIHIEGTNLLVDAGLIPPAGADPILPGGKVGPVRSARLLYIHIHQMFQYSCLIFAGATVSILGDIPACAQVHNTENIAGSMLEIDRMNILSEKNGINRGNGFNYASNLFAETPPEGGFPVEQLDLFFSSVNQAQWIYEPINQSWARYVDNASEEDTIFTRDTDKLTGRELSFENVIVLFVEHEVLRPRIADMHMEIGKQEKGYLFRDGRAYEILWSTRATDYERTTGLRRPVAFQDLDGNPIALRPGKTWIVIATPFSEITESDARHWRLRVYAPEGFGEY